MSKVYCRFCKFNHEPVNNPNYPEEIDMGDQKKFKKLFGFPKVEIYSTYAGHTWGIRHPKNKIYAEFWCHKKHVGIMVQNGKWNKTLDSEECDTYEFDNWDDGIECMKQIIENGCKPIDHPNKVEGA